MTGTAGRIEKRSTREYDFSRLSASQQDLLTAGGWRIGSEYPRYQPSARSMAKLIERGLVTTRSVKERAGVFSMTVTEYEVPVPVHIAWCEHCEAIENARKAKTL